MKLNTEIIHNELRRIGMTQIWLAGQINVSKQNFYNIMKRKSLRHVDKIARALDIDKRFLVKF